ncbi:MAG: DUF4091 domain-containing protein [Bacteroidales bacterium]|nr:DUF4091 domain-containing protein [Bacteroidales bacterium]
MRSLISILYALSFIIFPCLNIYSQKTDPYLLASGGFGRLIDTNPEISVWWCEGAYKVMRDTPVPSVHGDTIILWSARNEYEPFQVVVKPASRVENCRISLTDLISDNKIIDKQLISIRKVEYVHVTKPTDNYGYQDYWPDPLPEVNEPVKAFGGENTTFWITVYIPEESPAGTYTGKIEIGNSEWIMEIPIKLNVWDFTLPNAPSIRSGFGLSVDKISEYHNLKTQEDIRKTFDLYMKAFRDYKIAPYDPFYLYPIKEKITGLEWEGGIFDYGNSFNGEYSLMIQDDNPAGSPYAKYRKMIEIDPSSQYTLGWNIKAREENHQYCVLLEGYNREGEKMVFENRMEVFSSDTAWGRQEFIPGLFSDEVSSVSLSFFPAFRTIAGSDTGTIWIDNIVFNETGGRTNLIAQGDFEVSAGDINIELDFTDFDIAGRRYLDEFGFNSFRLFLKGMGSGTYYSRKEGSFEGFRQGTPVYEKLMAAYLKLMQQHLEEKGWLGKEYVYWFDEPGKKDYPFVREGMEIIKKSAPCINTFITENEPGPQIMDVTDITCTIFHRVDPAKAKEIVKKGQEYWSYLCTAPKYPWVSLFLDHDAINMRIWLWMTYAWDLNGILIWSSNYWTSYSASPAGYLQNPWAEPASFVQGYGWPYGKQTVWGNGDGRLFYPPNKKPSYDRATYIMGPVPSLRLEFLRQGIEDYEYMVILENLSGKLKGKDRKLAKEASKLLELEGTLFTDGKTYTKNPADLLEYRKKIADMIIKMNNIN